MSALPPVNGTDAKTTAIQVRPVDLDDPRQAAAFLALLDHYAADPMGGGTGLAPAARARLVDELRRLPHFHGALAWQRVGHGDSCDDGAAEDAVGLINCFAGFSTFAARPLLNIHDVVVRDGLRDRGIGRLLLAWAEARARELGCCKLTLEVLANNARARAAYARAGFAPYVLDSAAGDALFLHKPL
ncbi:GNAT family N-acetyltransferase [Oryzomicrobium sp.]|uniref:GNAT family N-acetyltransferase n=1 Tax=Oryzomicrobium sp. TaxID=1911578 RepID=UPI0025CF4CA1|nr:GNAT family N-acetyltransferase [Oryzomicrobium sp.]MCE1244161.1 GNAT family N-acetyltransferase [Oryzomicrobium sp.]